RGGIGGSRLGRVLVGLEIVPIGVALLLRYPALLDEYRVASPGDMVQRLLGLILIPRLVSLLQTILILRDLVLDLGCGDLGEGLPRRDVIADIDVALGYITAGAGVNVCLLEAKGGAWQAHLHSAVTLRDLLDADARDKIGLLFGGVHDLTVLRIMPPHPKSERTRNEEEDAEPEQPASGTASPPGLALRFGRIAIGCWKQRPRRRSLQRRRHIRVVHSAPSAITWWAAARSFPLRARANKCGRRRGAAGAAKKRPPMTARASAAFCSSPGPPIAIGIIPTIIAVAVISTGRMRVCPAETAAS